MNPRKFIEYTKAPENLACSWQGFTYLPVASRSIMYVRNRWVELLGGPGSLVSVGIKKLDFEYLMEGKKMKSQEEN